MRAESTSEEEKRLVEVVREEKTSSQVAHNNLMHKVFYQRHQYSWQIDWLLLSTKLLLLCDDKVNAKKAKIASRRIANFLLSSEILPELAQEIEELEYRDQMLGNNYKQVIDNIVQSLYRQFLELPAVSEEDMASLFEFYAQCSYRRLFEEAYDKSPKAGLNDLMLRAEEQLPGTLARPLANYELTPNRQAEALFATAIEKVKASQDFSYPKHSINYTLACCGFILLPIYYITQNLTQIILMRGISLFMLLLIASDFYLRIPDAYLDVISDKINKSPALSSPACSLVIRTRFNFLPQIDKPQEFPRDQERSLASTRPASNVYQKLTRFCERVVPSFFSSEAATVTPSKAYHRRQARADRANEALTAQPPAEPAATIPGKVLSYDQDSFEKIIKQIANQQARDYFSEFITKSVVVRNDRLEFLNHLNLSDRQGKKYNCYSLRHGGKADRIYVLEFEGILYACQHVTNHNQAPLAPFKKKLSQLLNRQVTESKGVG